MFSVTNNNVSKKKVTSFVFYAKGGVITISLRVKPQASESMFQMQNDPNQKQTVICISTLRSWTDTNFFF